MKPIVIMIIIVIVLLILGIWSFAYIEDTSNDLLDMVTEVEEELYKEDWESADERLKDFEKTWNTDKSMWTVLLDHTIVYNIEIYLARVFEYIDMEDDTEALSELAAIKRSLIHVIERQEFNLSNIL